MKRIFTLVTICLAVSFVSCTHKNSSLPSPSNPVITAADPAPGDWTVILYTSEAVDETPDFAGYIFTFAANGTFTATRSSLAIDGTWTRKADDGVQKLVLSISSATDPHLAELNEDWVISLLTNSNINLADDKGHHELKFQKAD